MGEGPSFRASLESNFDGKSLRPSVVFCASFDLEFWMWIWRAKVFLRHGVQRTGKFDR